MFGESAVVTPTSQGVHLNSTIVRDTVYFRGGVFNIFGNISARQIVFSGGVINWHSQINVTQLVRIEGATVVNFLYDATIVSLGLQLEVNGGEMHFYATPLPLPLSQTPNCTIGGTTTSLNMHEVNTAFSSVCAVRAGSRSGGSPDTVRAVDACRRRYPARPRQPHDRHVPLP